MLVDPGDRQIISGCNVKDLIDILFRDRKLSLLSCRHHFFVMSGTDSRIDANRAFASLVDLTELLQLA